MTSNRGPARLTDGRGLVVIRGGRIVDPASGRDEVGDVWMEDGRMIERPSDAREETGGRRPFVIDARGKVVTPGLIDMHVHLREPGREDKETIQSGARAGSAGGFTAVACMPNTDPVIDNAEVVHFVLERARQADIKVYPIGAITKGERGEQLAEIAEMVDAGIVGISDDGKNVDDPAIMRRALEYAKMFGIPVIPHCEDMNLSAGGVMNEGVVSTVLGLKGIPNAAEEVIVARDITLTELTGSRLHIAHVSTAGSVVLIREAKRRGIAVTAEATPHHFSLTDEAVRTYDTNTKVNPPLRTARDVEAIQEGLADGTIDVIATDHAPHTIDDKAVEYDLAPFGLIGLETALGLVIARLVQTGTLSLMDAIRKMTVAPARILGLPGGTLEPGAPADVTVFDPDRQWRVTPDVFLSRSRNSPFYGWTLRGAVEYTIVDGRVSGWAMPGGEKT
ncbi:MAG: dihydroorotase [Candidatus Latescibacteria bacterium]|nr:dihydroorotase [Candidatus Latescibacterota bacterium]